jgi:hypothetical protein
MIRWKNHVVAQQKRNLFDIWWENLKEKYDLGHASPGGGEGGNERIVLQ